MLGCAAQQPAAPPDVQKQIDRLAPKNRVEIRTEAAVELGRIGPPAGSAVPHLIATLRARYGKGIPREYHALAEKAFEAIRRIGPAAVPQLTRALAAGNTDHMLTNLLVHFGQPSVRPVLAVLANPNPYVRAEAANILGRIGDKEAVPALIERLADTHEEVRRRAAHALGRIADPRAVPALIRTLADKSSHVAWAAAGALGSTRDPRAIQPLLTMRRLNSGGPENRICGALAAIGPPVVKPLVNVLLDPKADHKDRAFLTLISMDPVPLSAVEPLMKSDANYPAQTIMILLGKAKDPRHVPYTIGVLRNHSDLWIRRAAAERLGKTADPRSLDPLHDALLKDKAFRVREAAGAALGNFKARRSVPALCRALIDRDHTVRRLAAKALGEIGDRRAVEPLVTALEVPGFPEYAVIHAAGQLKDPRAVPALIKLFRRRLISQDRLRADRRRVVDALVAIGSPARKLLMTAAAGAKDEYIRAGACTALGGLKQKDAVPTLIAALRDKADRARWSAAEALGEIGDRRAVEPLIAALKDRREYVRGRAAEALGKLGDRRAVMPLLPLLKERGYWAPVGAARALEKFRDPRSVPALIDTLGNEYSQVRDLALRTLRIMLGSHSFYLDRAKWTAWWDKNKARFLKADPPAAPVVP